MPKSGQSRCWCHALCNKLLRVFPQVWPFPKNMSFKQKGTRNLKLTHTAMRCQCRIMHINLTEPVKAGRSGSSDICTNNDLCAPPWMPGCQSTGFYEVQTWTLAIVCILWLFFIFYCQENRFTDMENPFVLQHLPLIQFLQFVMSPLVGATLHSL